MRFHHDLRFESGVEFYRNRYADEHSRCAERARTCIRRKYKVKNHRRDKSKQRKEDCSEKRESVVYLFEIIGSRLSRSYTGDKPAVLLYRLRDVFGIELNLRIEEREEYDKQAKYDRIERVSRICAEPGTPPSRTFFPACEGEDEFGEGEDREREDERHNAVGVDLYRNNCRLTAVHLVALDLFRVLNGNLSFGKFHPYDRREYHDDYYEIAYETKKFEFSVGIEFSAEDRRAFLNEELTRRSNDTREDKERNTVGYAVVGYSFADPHSDTGTCGEEKNYHDVRKERLEFARFRRAARQKSDELSFFDRRTTVTDEDTYRLNYRKQEGDITSDVRYFLSALFALLG